MDFRVTALPAGELDDIRSRGVDDSGNPLVVTENQEEGGAPLRCCLREAAVGEQVTLLAHRPSTVGGAYAEVGPVFVHADRWRLGAGYGGVARTTRHAVPAQSQRVGRLLDVHRPVNVADVT